MNSFQVSREVGERRVRLVPDADDDRHRRVDDRADHALVVEAPQVLERAAAAGKDQHVEVWVVVEALERADDGRRGLVALDAARAEHELDERIAAAHDVGDVAPYDADG